ncbi:MAG TPA: hypothetical protein VF511_01415 [Chthoniobacterales bacterium]
MPDQPILALVLYGPFLGVVFFELTHERSEKERRSGLGQLLVAVGLWVILQAAAVSYSRGGSGTGPIASRYLDILGLGVVVNVLALCYLMTRHGRRDYSFTLRACAGIWLVAVLTFGTIASRGEIQGQSGRKQYLRSAERAVRLYLATNDHRSIEGEPHPIPYPDMARMAMFLNDKAIQALLPASARMALPIRKSGPDDEAFTQPGCPPVAGLSLVEPGWGSYSAQAEATRGSMVTELFGTNFPYLQLDVGGGLDNDRSLVVEENDGRRPVKWLERYSNDDNHPDWRLAYVHVHTPAVRLEARDNSATTWFAFHGPREMGPLSFFSYRFVQTGKALCFWGISLGLLFVLAEAWPFAARRAEA